MVNNQSHFLRNAHCEQELRQRQDNLEWNREQNIQNADLMIARYGANAKQMDSTESLLVSLIAAGAAIGLGILGLIFGLLNKVEIMIY